MGKPYKIFVDSSSDLSRAIREQYGMEYFQMGISVKDVDYPADMDWEAYSPEQLYSWIADLNNHCHTSLVTYGEYKGKLEKAIQEGNDVLYIACSTALSGSLNSFRLVAKELEEKYPGTKLIGIDSRRANMALGLLAIHAGKLQQEGKTIEEVAAYVENRRQFFHEVGSLETLTYLRAAGRVSGPAAFFGNLIGLKPIIMFDTGGHNYAFKKVRGSKNALVESFEYIKENINENTDVIYIGQAMAKDAQAYLKKRIEEELHIRVEEFWIGPIVGISCGPGMYGCFFEGKEVTVSGEK